MKEVLMPDIADQAQTEESYERDVAILAALHRPAGCEDGPDWIQGIPYCRECGEPIPIKRIKAMPGTGLCVECASEAQENRMGTAHRPSDRLFYKAL